MLMTAENTNLLFQQQGISADTPDWSREKKLRGAWQPSRALLSSIRQYQQREHSGNIFIRLSKKLSVIQHRFWSIVTGADIPLNSKIGGGLLLPHPNGVVIHPDAEIGPNCLIFQQVTIGSRNGSAPPVIGGHVDIGAGAKIIGAIKIGNNVEIGANAVVLSDVPDNCIAVGVPARVKQKKLD